MTPDYPHLLVTKTHSRWGASASERIPMYMLAYRPTEASDMKPITSGSWQKIAPVRDQYMKSWRISAYYWERGRLLKMEEE